MMTYKLFFKFKGVEYSNSQIVPQQYLDNQIEAVACGLLLGKIDEENLPRTEWYYNLKLIERNDSGGTESIVWEQECYLPISKNFD